MPISPLRRRLGGMALSLLLLSGCSAVDPAPGPPPVRTAPGAISTESVDASATDRDVVGATVRFTSSQGEIEVVIDQDSAAVRDFLDMMPMTLDFKEYNGREKIADPPRPLERGDTPGSHPVAGDLIYFEPWGNFGFYYNAEGSQYEETTVHLGVFDASEEELAVLEAGPVRVDLVE